MRRLLLWAARNRWLRDHLSRTWVARRAVRKFMPGEELEDALAAAEGYRSEGIGSVFTLLGENLTSIADAEAVAAHYRDAQDAVVARGLDTEMSVKLTQLGFDIDPDATARYVDELAVRAAERNTWLWIDMEASDYVERTVALYEAAAAKHRNVGLCVQAYLRRTPDDLRRLAAVTPSIRLVKGAYDEPAALAYRAKREVDAAYVAVASRLIAGVADGSVQRAILATHDTTLIEQLAAAGASLGLPKDRVEIQMLYGIRAGEQRRLARAGFSVRGLVAYGRYWYPWYMRRLAERPANVIFAMRALLPF
jgi:proline dehydrogenase